MLWDTLTCVDHVLLVPPLLLRIEPTRQHSDLNPNNNEPTPTMAMATYNVPHQAGMTDEDSTEDMSRYLGNRPTKKKHTKRTSIRSHPPARNLSAVPNGLICQRKISRPKRERSTSNSPHVTVQQLTDHSTSTPPLSQTKTRLLQQHPPPTSSRQRYR
jgi:hypothetical protein